MRLKKNCTAILSLAVIIVVLSLIKTPTEHLRALDKIDLAVLTKGEKEMAARKLVVVGISRDNAIPLPNVIENIEFTGAQFEDYRVIIFENDSSDGTKEILKDWAIGNNKVKIITKDFHNKKRPNIQFLADLRNIYLHELEESEYKNFDTVMMLDMDMSYGWDIRGVKDSFAKINDWDVVCSNGIDGYDFKMWDVFAFRSERFPDGLGSPDYWTANLRNIRKVKHQVGDNLLSVYSCFGGMAFYKKNTIKQCKYKSINDDCEHVPFHECIRLNNKGKIMLNPNQVIRYRNYFWSQEDISYWMEDVSEYYWKSISSLLTWQ